MVKKVVICGSMDEPDRFEKAEKAFIDKYAKSEERLLFYNPLVAKKRFENLAQSIAYYYGLLKQADYVIIAERADGSIETGTLYESVFAFVNCLWEGKGNNMYFFDKDGKIFTFSEPWDYMA